MNIKEQLNKINNVIKILSKQQVDIKYILKKYKNQEILTIFDEKNFYNKETLRALFYIKNNIYEKEFKSYYIPTKYIYNDLIYDYLRTKEKNIIEEFFIRFEKMYKYKIRMSDLYITIEYDKNTKYRDLKMIAYVMNLLLKEKKNI